MPNQIPVLREKWEKLSEFMKEIKQGFSRYYNKRHNRRGFFWSDRFKSVLVEDGETLITRTREDKEGQEKPRGPKGSKVVGPRQRIDLTI